MRPRTGWKEVAAMKQFRSSFSRRLMVTAVSLALLVIPATGQQERPKKSQDAEAITLNTPLVQVPVVVSEGGGRYISDLTQDEFSIFEDGVKQRIELFGSVEEPF